MKNEMAWNLPDCERYGSCRDVKRCLYLSSLCYIAQESSIDYANITVARRGDGRCTFTMRSCRGIPDDFSDEVAHDIGLIPEDDVRSEPSLREDSRQ